MNILRPLAAMLALASASTVQADERIFLSGGEYSDVAYYTYAGLIVPGPGRENGRGFMQRYWVDRFGYEYDGAPGRVEASAFGAEAALGYGASSTAGWWTVSLGLRYTDTDLTPDDRSANARGSQLGGKVQLDLDRALASAWRGNVIMSYSNQQDAYWGRVRVMHDATPTRALGIEVIANGNNEADSTAAGLVASLRPAASSWTVSLKAGYRFQDEADGVYGGLEYGFGF